MDLRAVKGASRRELAQCAIATARNAQGLLHDAELLAGAGRRGRAYSVAVLSVEECGKAMDLTALAVIPDKLRHQAPVGRMLQSHQLKLVGGLMLAVLPFGGIWSTIAFMPTADLNRILSILGAPADESEQLKRRGFYVDMDRACHIREPSEVTEREVERQLGQARKATTSVARVLLDPRAHATLAQPPAEGLELAQDLVNALIAAGYIRTPKDAANVILKVVGDFRDRRGVAQSAPPSR